MLMKNYSVILERVDMKNRDKFAWLMCAGIGLVVGLVIRASVGPEFGEIIGFAAGVGTAGSLGFRYEFLKRRG